MKAVIVEHAGGELKIADIDEPKPGPDQLLVKSLYMSLNPL